MEEQDPLVTAETLEDMLMLFENTRRILVAWANKEGLYDEVTHFTAEVAQGITDLMKEVIDLQWRVFYDTQIFGKKPVFSKKEMRICIGDPEEGGEKDASQGNDF